MSAWTIDFYESDSGAAPVQEYLETLSKRELARVRNALRLLQDIGTDLGMPHVKKLGSSGLWELRVRGSIDHRIFYVALRGRRMLLLHAITKKQQHIPAREVRTAERRLRDYYERFPQ